MLEFLLEILIEIFGQVILEWVLVELFRILGALFRSVWGSVPTSLNWLPPITVGAVGGLVSVAIVPHYFVTHPALRLVNCALSALAFGLLMKRRGEGMVTKGRPTFSWDSFAGGAALALAFTLTRWCLLHLMEVRPVHL
jgi:hypothetical protein